MSFVLEIGPTFQSIAIGWRQFLSQTSDRRCRLYLLKRFVREDVSIELGMLTKEFVRLHLRRVNVQDDEDPNPVTFSVALIAARSSYDIAPIPGLRALPESKLSYPGSTHLQDSTLGRMTGSTSAIPAKVEQMFETTASVDDIKRYFDRELIARGWKAVDPPSDLRFGRHPSATWQKNEVLAALMASRASSATVTYYWFAIAEILGPDQTPGLPWE